MATKRSQARVKRLACVVGERVIASLPILIFGCEAYLFRFRHRVDPPVYTPLKIKFRPKTHEEGLRYLANPNGVNFSPSLGGIIFAEIKVLWPRRLYPICYPLLRFYSNHLYIIGSVLIFLYRYASGKKRSIRPDFVWVTCIQAATCSQVLFLVERTYHRMISIAFSGTAAGHLIQNTLFLIHVYVVIFIKIKNLIEVKKGIGEYYYQYEYWLLLNVIGLTYINFAIKVCLPVLENFLGYL